MAEYTPAAHQVVRNAQMVAEQFSYPFIQREQLFLGLLEDASVGRILGLVGLDLEVVRQEVLGRLSPGMAAPNDPEAIELLPTAEQVYRQRAQTAAAILGHTQIGPAEVLLGFLLEQSGTVVEILAARGVTKENVMEAIRRLDQ